MKKIIALIISAIMIIVAVYSYVDDLNTGVQVVNDASPALKGDYQTATTNVVNTGTDYVIGAVYFAIIMAFVSIIIGILKKV